MKADRNDAPEAWLASRPRKNGNPGIVLAGVIGTVITLGALNVAGQAFKQTTVKSVAENRQQATITPIAEVARAEPVPAKDWDRIVEEQARRDAMPRQEPEQANNSEPPVARQRVFNDQNYIPRGADNVLSSRAIPKSVPQEQPKEKLRVIGIKEEAKLKDFCGGREGSIERRNCRSQIGLDHRD